MITPAEALALIMETVQPGSTVSLPLEQAAGHFLASDIAAPISLPLFDNSAMDGFAVRSSDIKTASSHEPVTLNVVGVVAAGDEPKRAVLSGEAIQIFTGAMIPPEADTVVRQEDVSRQVNGNTITLEASVPAGTNIRRAGEEINRGDTVLNKGDKLSPAAIGVLACMGISQVTVRPKPRVGCIVTGSELRPPGTRLQPGQIYNSNAAMLTAALADAGLALAFSKESRDELEILTSALQKAIAECDVVLLTGGISVGEFDFVRAAALRSGVSEVFWKVAQKPGKPIYFGITPDRKTAVFGLPGNPASALTCFYEYVKPALKKIMGAAMCDPLTYLAPLDSPFSKRGNLTQFMKGFLNSHGTVSVLEQQGSHMLSSYARANCLVVIPPDANHLQKGDKVQVHLTI